MEENLNFRSPKKLLSGKELQDIPVLTTDFSLISRGLKTTCPKFTAEEHQKLQEYRNNLKLLLSLERAVMARSRSFGIFEQEFNRVRVERKEGKWNFGYCVDQLEYLYPHEALYLIEMNRMEIHFNSVIISVEQAYSLFLGTSKGNLDLSQYLVYSKLMRSGFILYKHGAAKESNKKPEKRNPRVRETTLEADIIWNCLLEQLNQPVHTELIDKEKELYKNIKDSMRKSCEDIKTQSTKYQETKLTGETFWKSPVKRDSDKNKRKNSNEMKSKPSSSKKLKFSERSGSFLDILKGEVEYKEFREIFESINIVRKLEDYSEVKHEGFREFQFTFDVFSPNALHKKYDPPDYRLIIVNATEGMPTNAEIVRLSQQHSDRIPILLILVYDNCSFHSYVYEF